MKLSTEPPFLRLVSAASRHTYLFINALAYPVKVFFFQFEIILGPPYLHFPSAEESMDHRLLLSLTCDILLNANYERLLTVLESAALLH